MDATLSNAEQLVGFGHAGGWEAKFAGGHAGEAGEMVPAERRAHGGKLFGDGAVVFFRMKSAVFADGVAEKQVENWTDGPAQLAIAMHQSEARTWSFALMAVSASSRSSPGATERTFSRCSSNG